MNIGHRVRPSVTCPICGRTSHHPKDVEHGYCAHCHAFTGAHLRRIAPRTVPGALFMRIVTEAGIVLAQHPMTEVKTARSMGEVDVAIVGDWRDEHGGRVYVYAYDGDSGECLHTIIVGDSE